MSNRLLLTIVAAIAILTISVGQVSALIDTDSPRPVEFVDMPAEFVDAVIWATDLFDQAELELPPLRFVYHGHDTRPCAERPGLHHRVDGLNVIEICTETITNPTKGLILHETAHAWIDHHLTDERKAAFKELRGWTHWRDYDAAPWHENGTEQAAEIMVWGLIDRPLKMVRINGNSCDELDAGYRTLTGRPPLNGFRDAC
jgi:hypothetical protein